MRMAACGSVAVLVLWLVTGVSAARAGPPNDTGVQFDAVIELNARSGRSHVVLFVRYWVAARFYRAAVVWGEPHEGSLNFPIYPPTLNVASDPNAFAISHQLQHVYDGVFCKPLDQRGPFRHRFNSYSLADTRFAEREALALRVYAGDLEDLEKCDEERQEVKALFDQTRDGHTQRDAAQIRVRSSQGRLDALDLLDSKGHRLESLTYEYENGDTNSPLLRERVWLPERPITVGFNGPGPRITIAGETRQSSELETVHHESGRRCVVDYGVQSLGGRRLSLPVRVVVYSGDQGQVLRSVRLYDFVACQGTPAQIQQEAQRYSGFDANEMSCRGLLLKHWMRDPGDIPPADANVFRRLRADFSGRSPMGASAGQQLKRINALLQLDWRLDDPNQLEKDFRDYLSLLSANDLPRMVLFGGQNAIEVTVRWHQFGAADTLLRVWLDFATAFNDVASLLDFASAGLARGRYWTVAELADRVLTVAPLSPSQRFVAQAIRCIALARLRETKERADSSATDLATTQKRWAMAHWSDHILWVQINEGMDAAQRAFAPLDRPTQAERGLKRQLDTIRRNLLEYRSADNEPARSGPIEEPPRDD